MSAPGSGPESAAGPGEAPGPGSTAYALSLTLILTRMFNLSPAQAVILSASDSMIIVL